MTPSPFTKPIMQDCGRSKAKSLILNMPKMNWRTPCKHDRVEHHAEAARSGEGRGFAGWRVADEARFGALALDEAVRAEVHLGDDGQHDGDSAGGTGDHGRPVTREASDEAHDPRRLKTDQWLEARHEREGDGLRYKDHGDGCRSQQHSVGQRAALAVDGICKRVGDTGAAQVSARRWRWTGAANALETLGGRRGWRYTA